MLIGNLGKDPETRRFENDLLKASFPMATTEYYRDRNGDRQEKTEWHNIVCWRRLAEIAESYLKKGSMVFVEGRIRTRSWEDQSGEKKYITEIEAVDFKMLDKKSSGSGSDQGGNTNYRSGGQQQQGGQQNSGFSNSGGQKVDSGMSSEEDDDLPF